MPNLFASVALFAWPLVVVVLFRTTTVPKALVISILGGYLLLPVKLGYDLPLLPTYDKGLAATLPALVMALVMSRRSTGPGAAPAVPCRPGWLPRSLPLRICFAALVAGSVLTVVTNGDALAYPLRTLNGLRLYDAGSAILIALTLMLPFLLGRKYLARPEDQTMLLAIFVVGALAYSLPTLWEARMSPRLNVQIYGFFPHSWEQHLRAGGFRPVVFLEHGLRLGLFLSTGLLASAIILRLNRGDVRVAAIVSLGWLLATLVISKNLTAFLIVCLLLPVILIFRARTQLIVAGVLAGIVLVYPMMRASGLIPMQMVTGAIASFADSDRLASLDFRFTNEDMLLEKARERPLFGWGGWGRARVYNSAGRDISTTDGAWILEFGEGGWMGYLARFGLLTLPVMLLAFRRQDEISLGTSGLAVVLAANLLDLLPNSGLTPLTWLMAGSLAGRLEARTADNQEFELQAAPAAARPGSLPYRRFPSTPPARERRPPATGVRTSLSRRTPSPERAR